jgi:hypothetical protein
MKRILVVLSAMVPVVLYFADDNGKPGQRIRGGIWVCTVGVYYLPSGNTPNGTRRINSWALRLPPGLECQPGRYLHDCGFC